MAASLSKLRGKLRKRKDRRERQTQLWKKTRKAGHGKAAKRHTRAIKKLKALVRKLKALLVIDWNGCAPVGGPNLRKVVRYALLHYNVYVTSTNGGTHTPTSYHYRNQAVDIGSDDQAEKGRCQQGLYKKFGASIFAELFGPDNSPWVKDGSTYTEPEGTALESLHDSHVHLAITS